MISGIIVPPQSMNEAKTCWYGMSRYQRMRLANSGWLEAEPGGGSCQQNPTVEIPRCRDMPRRGPRWVCADCAAALAVSHQYDPPDP